LNGTPTQILAAIVPSSAVFGSVSQKRVPCSNPSPCKKKLITPKLPSSIQRKILPLTTVGSSQPNSSSARSKPLPGNGRLKNSASAKPITNWNSSEPPVNSSETLNAC